MAVEQRGGLRGGRLGHRPRQPARRRRRGTVPSVCRLAGPGDQRALGLERQKRRRLVEPDPAHLVELVVVAAQVAAHRDHQEVVHGLVDAGADPGRTSTRSSRTGRTMRTIEAGLLGHLAQRRLLSASRPGWAFPWAASRSRRHARAGACRRPAAAAPSTNRMTMPPAEVAVACLRRATRGAADERRGPAATCRARPLHPDDRARLAAGRGHRAGATVSDATGRAAPSAARRRAAAGPSGRPGAATNAVAGRRPSRRSRALTDGWTKRAGHAANTSRRCCAA